MVHAFSVTYIMQLMCYNVLGRHLYSLVYTLQLSAEEKGLNA